MTPGARVAAAIDILDRIAAGTPAEQALTGWARGNRFAGSGDRAVIRDHVFDTLRCWRSFAAMGGAATGRGLMLGALRADGADPAALFTGAGYAPPPVTEVEKAFLDSPLTLDLLVALDCPDWLAPALRDSLGDDFAAVMAALRHRAPVFLRVNLARGNVAGAIAALAAEGIRAVPHPLAKSALEVTENARKIQTSAAYATGLVELQDAASQAVVEMLPLRAGMQVLDYCAGGGGKALAMAARAPILTHAHDIDPGRMRDLPARAARAGTKLRPLPTAALASAAPFDLVLADAPCSGSGSWRRAPEAKWRLTPGRLAELTQMQAGILVAASQLVGPGGVLAYATCSLLNAENQAQVAAFLAAHPGWQIEAERRLTPLDGGDGFFVAIMRRNKP
ncbi:MAG: RsmB/NOP family class I SAM-dependent RNA methyltransferase [Rhodobacteraceae bacterium]|nr:RsmB/NOP family class I SAM-dependent RNA methyltransferase [Paracoccaceae bacterium]